MKKAPSNDKPINVQQLLRTVANDKDIFNQYLNSFDAITLPSRLKTFHSAWKAEDYRVCKKEAFQLQNGGSSIAAKKFMGICKKMVQASKEEDKQTLDANYGDLLQESKRIKYQIVELTESTLNLDYINDMIEEYNLIYQPKIKRNQEAIKLEVNKSKGEMNDTECGNCILIQQDIKLL